MVILILLLLEFFALYFVSKWLLRTLFAFFYRIFPNEHIAIGIITTITFVGTVIHELSHLFTAEILGVRTGKLTLLPKRNKGQLEAGSVEIAKTNPLKRYIIGLAPTLIGLMLLTALSWWFQRLIPDIVQAYQDGSITSSLLLQFLVVLYLLFAISTSMFSSKQDLQDFLPFTFIIGLLFWGFYALGLRISVTGVAYTALTQATQALLQTLGFVLVLNLILFLVFRAILYMISSLFSKKPQQH